jgi:DNA polymerase-3 subunit alpha
VPRGKATQLFDLMEKFAGYGFNKSHAAAYALVAYQTAYFKAHHAAAFMAANLSLVMDDTDKVRALYADALEQGLAILPPDVNASAYRFEPVDEKRVRYGLGAVKGTGQQAIESIVAARAKGGPFRDLFDFARRVDKRLCNRRVVEALVKAGAFDAIDARRATLHASVGVALEAAERAEAAAGQVSLFGEEAREAHLPLVAARPWVESERLAHEKSALGFYVSGHPFHAYAAELAPLVKTTLGNLQPRAERYLVAGIVTSLRVQSGKRGKIAFVTLDDGRSSAEIVVYNENFDAARALLAEDRLVVVEVRVLQRVGEDGEVQGLRVIADGVFDLAGVRRRWAKRLRLSVNGNADVSMLEDVLKPFRGDGVPVTVSYDTGRIVGDIELPDAWNVTPDAALIDRLREWLQPANVEVVY